MTKLHIQPSCLKLKRMQGTGWKIPDTQLTSAHRYSLPGFPLHGALLTTLATPQQNTFCCSPALALHH